jgi:hypothetical protein
MMGIETLKIFAPIRQLIFLLAILICACSDDSNPVTTICYSFEERQCNGDPWIEELGSANLSDEQKAVELRTYLENQSIDVVAIEVVVNQDLITCQACFVCATGTSYIIEADPALATQVESLDLLSLQEVPCSQ